MAATPPTFRSLITTFTDFLTVALHTIIYERSIYPQTSFLSARKYNFSVRQNRHPKVCEWINDAVAAVESELLKCTVDKVVMVIYDKTHTPRERFIFDVSHFPDVIAPELDTTLERIGADGETVAVLPLIDIEEQFRAAVSKLGNCGSTLQPLPSGCTFTVVIELKGEGAAPVGHPQPWIPVQPSKQANNPQKGVSRTTPVRTVAAGDMAFEIWIEEAKSDDVSPRSLHQATG